MSADWSQPIDSGNIPNTDSNFDVIVVGGGPSGSSAASFAAMAGHKVLLLEKATYPRDKTCGDAVGGSAMRIVTELGVRPMIEGTPLFRVDSIIFSGPGKNTTVKIDLPADQVKDRTAGYSLPRLQFDYMMFKRATELILENGGSIIQNFTVRDIHVDGVENEQRITGVSGIIGGNRSGNEPLTFHAPLTVGAGGFNCPVAKTITETCHNEPMRDNDHYIAAYREYWEMEHDGDVGAIEIHFIGGKLANGYFWIFPVSDKIANVGCGMVINDMNKMNTKLRELQAWCINESEQFSERFANCKMIEGTDKGHLIPCGSPRKNAPSYQPRRFAMAGAACVGDASSWVDPLSGEGLHQGLLSGKMLIPHFRETGRGGSLEFSSESAHEYQVEMWGKLGPVLSNSFKLQKLVRKKWLLNWLLRKAAKDNKRGKAIRNQLELAVSTKSGQADMASTWQLLKMVLF
ncbi:MAG: NAD(P)/FAD-dependent oxidoreductase [Candidatus Thalassarchaeaceae archaeon]|jgi:flavin-dependent dehydrogenase|nr:NAD(P)/FAD-dependent oxidoreductase [Candidatus Thalassarchaeaceae archaeon]